MIKGLSEKGHWQHATTESLWKTCKLFAKDNFFYVRKKFKELADDNFNVFSHDDFFCS